MDAVEAEPWFEQDVGDELGGMIELEEVARITGLVWPQRQPRT